MEQRVAAANAEKDRQSMEQMQEQIEKDKQATLAVLNVFEKIAEKNINAKKEMNAELDQIHAEAERQIRNTKNRYAANYGSQTWNTDTDDLFRNLARETTKKK